MNARTLQENDTGTELEVLAPVLFNTWKHHAGALRQRIETIADLGVGGLHEVASRLAVLGTRLMDVYTGTLSPRALSAWILEELKRINQVEPGAFQEFLLASEEYALFTHPEDGSRWVLRLGDLAGRYIHLHPGRWSPCSLRVRANVLKTAFLVLIDARIHGTDPMDRARINFLRTSLLGLSPIGQEPAGELGLGAMITLLRTPEC